MPAISVFGRRWLVASDDFVFPGLFHLVVRLVCWISFLILFTKGDLNHGAIEAARTYLTGLLVILALIILSLCAIVYVSAQGVILDTDRRASMPTLVYLRSILGLSELVWTCLGTKWLYYNRHSWDPTTVAVVSAGVISSWIIMLFIALRVTLTFDPLGLSKMTKAQQKVQNLQRNTFFRVLSKVSSWASWVWEYRLWILCCCLPDNDRNQAAIANIAKILSKFFSNTTFVPSDIAAGLSLLQQEQEKELSRDTKTVTEHSSSSSSGDDLEQEVENCAHWIKFASAAYSLPNYIYSFLLSRPCHIFEDYRNYDIVGGKEIGFQFASIMKLTGLQPRDFICVSFHDKVFQVPFFVSLDNERKAVVVAVRGTLSLEDALTDLSIGCEELPVDGVSGACYAHEGMYKTAKFIYDKLMNNDDGILHGAFSKVPEYKLVITGHSLGAGTASILAILLRRAYPTLRCYSFSPPGCLLSKALVDYSKDFVVSVVLGKDMVPRLSLQNMEALKKEVFQIVKSCDKPKYRILLQALWYQWSGDDPDDLSAEMIHRRQQALVLYQGLVSVNAPANRGPDIPLLPPGRIVYITSEKKPRRSFYSRERYGAVWSDEEEFKTILVSSKMIADHLSDAVMEALNSLISQVPYRHQEASVFSTKPCQD